MLRLLLASLFVFAAMLGTVAALGSYSPDGDLPTWSGPLIIAVTFAAIAFALVVFNSKGRRPFDSSLSVEQRIRDLDSAGLIIRQAYTARRCFAVEESEDEGLHYYLELEDRRVLFLSGQYLYDYQEITDDPELNQPATFPCARFEILRHKTEAYVVSMECHGEVLVPECVTPPFSKQEFRKGSPDDGDIITDKTYDQIKAERLGRTDHLKNT
jgi:hypothetical protein